MKKLILSIFLVTQFAFAQQHAEKISISFQNVTLKEALNAISEETSLSFFYLDKWITDIIVTGDYTDIPIIELLNALLSETVINYYIMDNGNVILTPNNVLYDELPTGFFGREPDTTTQEILSTPQNVRPIFSATEKTVSSEKLEVVRIGKVDPQNQNETFTLSGYAQNAANSEPIQDLAILVDGMGLGASTNESGYYEIELPAGSHIIKTRSLGIRNTEREVIIYGNGSLNMQLSESLEQLDEVVVEADAAQNVEEAATGTNYVESEKSKNIPLVLGERDILQVAKALPGITSSGEGAAGFNVRGGKIDQNLILLDDALIYNPTHFFGVFQALNPFTTKGMNIYKASVPVEYGGRLSAVFDIETKDGNTSKFAGEGSIGPVTGNLALEIPIATDKSSLILGGRGAYSDWILRSLDEEDLQNSKASFFDVLAKYKDHINENNDLSATAYHSQDVYSVTRDSIYSYQNSIFSLRWDYKFNERNTGNLILAHSNYGFDIDYEANSNRNFGFGYGIDETEAKIKIRSQFFEDHTFNYGAASKLYHVRPGRLRPNGSDSVIEAIELDEEKALESAIFLSDEIEVNDKLLLDLGVRYSFFTALGPSTQRTYPEDAPRSESTVTDTLEFGNNEKIKTFGGPEIRASARYYLGKNLSIKAGYNTSYQYIHRLSNNTTASPIDTWKLSDLNIEPQKGEQFSLGLYKNLKENEYELSLEGYYKISENIIDFKTGAELLMNENIETEVLQGKGKAYGIEFLARKNRGRLNGWVSYTYSRSLYKFDSEFSAERINNGVFFPSNYDKPHDVSLIANYRFTQRYSASLNFVYQTGRPVTYPTGSYTYNGQDYVYYSNRNEFRIPDYYRLDLGLNIEGNHKKNKLAHGFWTISIYNVLGRNNPYSVFFVTEGGEIKAYKSSIFAIPIPSITYNFKF